MNLGTQRKFLYDCNASTSESNGPPVIFACQLV
jgi:hypothetical protein